MMVMVTGVIIMTMVILMMVVRIIIRIVTIVMMMTLQQLRRWWWRWWWWWCWWRWGRWWRWATTEGDKFGHQATIYLIGVNGRSSDREGFRHFHENHHHNRNFLFNLVNQFHFSLASYKGVVFFIGINITSNFNGWHARQLLFLFSNISRSPLSARSYGLHVPDKVTSVLVPTHNTHVHRIWHKCLNGDHELYWN